MNNPVLDAAQLVTANRSERINSESKRNLAKAKTRYALLKSALQLYSHEGKQGLSMNKVAKGAGIAQPSFYNHFASLDALQDELCEQLKLNYLSPMRMAWVDLVKDFDSLDDETSIARCQDCLSMIFDAAFLNINLFQRLIEDRPRILHSENQGLGRLVIELQEEWTDIFMQGLSLAKIGAAHKPRQEIKRQDVYLFIDIASAQVHELILGCHARRYHRAQAIQQLSKNFKQLFISLFIKTA